MARSYLPEAGVTIGVPAPRYGGVLTASSGVVRTTPDVEGTSQRDAYFQQYLNVSCLVASISALGSERCIR